MKQIIITFFTVLSISVSVKAQVKFTTLHFTRNEMFSDGIGGEYAHVTSSGSANGTIDIDTKDSIIRIQTGTPGSYGEKLKTYKFNLIDEEQTSIYDDGITVMSVKFHGVNVKNIPYTARIARQIEKNKKAVMIFTISYDQKNVETFVCDYEKDLHH